MSALSSIRSLRRMLVAAAAAGLCLVPQSSVHAADGPVDACAQYLDRQARIDCLQQESAKIARELDRLQGTGAEAPRPPPRLQARDSLDEEVDEHPVIRSRVSKLSYADGRPVFVLANGQTWYSLTRRRLTPSAGGDTVKIVYSTVGMLLHFNGSFFALPVVNHK